MTTRLTRYYKYKKNKNKMKRRAAVIAIMMIVLSVFDFFSSSMVSAASSHSTRINVSSDQVKQNGNITLTAEAIENGTTVTSGYTYRFLYNTDGSTSAYALGGYSSNSWYKFSPAEISGLKNYTGPVFLFADSKTGSTSVWSKYKIVNILPNDEESLKVTGTVTSAGSYMVGEKLFITMTASGGKSPYTYKYEYGKAGGTYSTYKDYTSTSSVTMPTDSWSANTDYYIKVTVKDSDNKTFSFLSAVSLTPKVLPTPTISSVSVASTGNVGDKLKINCNASGGTGTLQYKFSYINSSNSEKTIRDYANSDNVTWDTTGLSAGSYTVKAVVKDSNGKTSSQKATVTLFVPTPTITTFSAPDSARIGEKVKLSCDASGGTGSLEYKFSYINDSNSEKTIKDYSSSDNVTWDTKSLTEGSYTVKVTVRDGNKKTVNRKSTIRISKTPTLSPTISTDPNNGTIIKGKDITFTVDTHSDGSENFPPQPYTYKFEYQKTGSGSYTVLRSYGDSEKYKYNTKNLDAGDYTLKATVKDKNGKEYSKTVRFTVEVPVISFSVDPGAKDFFTGGDSNKAVVEIKNVKGGISDEYEYKFEYIKYGSLTDTNPTPPTNSSAWKKIKDFSSESSADFTVKNDDDAGIYAVRVSVQNKGNTSSSLIYRQIISGYTVKVKVKHTLADVNALVDKFETWVQNSMSGNMLEKIRDWSPANEEYENYPFNYNDLTDAYIAAKSCNTDGNKDYDTIYANLESEITKLQNLINSGFVDPDMSSYSPFSSGFATSTLQLYKEMLNGVTFLFDYCCGEEGSIFFSFDYDAVAEVIFPVFKTFAYALIIIFAGVNALESALQYEMFTMRGGVRILARLTFAKIWVDISLVVCQAIVSIAIGWMSEISIVSTEIADSLHFDMTLQHSTIWGVGVVIDYFNAQAMTIMISLLLLPLLIMVIILYIKLFIRSFELAMLQCVSPVFFACLTGEQTKQYFKKFLMTYISVAVEVVFMALIWYIYVEYLKQAFTIDQSAQHDLAGLNVTSVAEMFSMESGVFNFFMVSIGAYILMIKPPQILKNLVRE